MAYYHLFYTYDIICELICQVVSILILYVVIISFLIKDQIKSGHAYCVITTKCFTMQVVVVKYYKLLCEKIQSL